MERESIKKHIVLGTNEAGEVIVLDHLFRYDNGFHGATGAVLEPVTQEDIANALSSDEMEEWFEDAWRYDVSINGTIDGLADWVADQDEDDYLEMRFETYQDLEVEEIAEALGVIAPERYALVGGGRIFPGVLEGLTLIDSDAVRDAVRQINEYEEGNR